MIGIRAIDRKLLRDLWRMRGQALAIAAVIGSGVAMYVMMMSAFDSLELTQRTYYDRYRFGDVFASLVRAPSRLAERIDALPGVAASRTRVVADVTLDVPGLEQPASGRLVSIPAQRRPVLDDVVLIAGRWIDGEDPDEVLVHQGFAEANGLRPGDHVGAIINGRLRRLKIVGIALSPEFVYTIRPGELVADDKMFGIFWMERRALGAAFDMEGAFNDVVLRLEPGASADAAIDRLDRLLAPYGGGGAIPRALQPSHFYLQNELDGLRGFGTAVPAIFLLVAAFLLNVVLTRIVTVQREQIAELKALGYADRAVGLHYIKWSLAIAAVGAVVGLAVGARLGAGMTEIYTVFFDFPILRYRLTPAVALVAVAIALVAAVIGALSAVRRVIDLPPAVAMRPEPPATYRASWIERAGARRFLSQPARIVLRNLARHRGRAAASVIGIAFSGGLMILGTFSMDSMERMTDVQFNVAQRYDAALTFVEPVSPGGLDEVARLPGVMRVEPVRTVPARLRFGNRTRTTSIMGQLPDAVLSRVIDASDQVVEPPAEGLVLSRMLADVLGAGEGDLVTVEVLSGRRPVRRVPVTRLVDDFMGMNATMDIDALHRLLDEGDVLSGAVMQIDTADLPRLFRTVKQTPSISGLGLKQSAIDNFNATIAETFAISRNISIVFAAIIAFGVAYNSARISLSERGRELATLRVIGFRRSEIAAILVGELMVLTALAVPLGCVVGWFMAGAVVHLYQTEFFRMPLVVFPRTFALGALVVIVSAVVSALAVRGRLRRLDLIAVLKTRE